MSAERRVARNAAWLVLQPLVMNVLSLAATGYIARSLGSSEFGRFNLAYAFVAMFAPLANMGLRALAVRHVAQNRAEAGDYLGKVLVLRLLLAVACAALIVGAAPFLIGGSKETQIVVAVAAIGTILTTLAAVYADGFQAFEVMRPISLANLASGVLLTVASVLVVWHGGGIGAMAVAYALGPLCTVLLLWLWSRGQPFRPRPRWDPGAFGEMLRQGSPFFAIALLDVVSVKIDIVVLRWVLGDGNLGSYTAATSLVDRAMILCDGAATALLPAIAFMSMHTPAAAVPLLRRSSLWLLAASLPVAVATAALAPLLVTVIFGGQYAAAAPILAIAIWRLPATCLAMLEGHSLIAVKRQDLVLRTGAIAMVVCIALIYPLVHAFGPAGGALALTIRPLLTFLLRMPAMARHFPNLWPWGQLARVAAALALMAVPLALIPPLGLVEAIGHVLAACSLYLLGLMLMRVLPPKAVIHPLCRRFSKAAPAFAPAAEAPRSAE